jgi:hypothetical protein
MPIVPIKPAESMFRMDRELLKVGSNLLMYDHDITLEVVGYQKRFHCPDEGPSMWMECGREDAMIIERNRSAGWEIREVFTYHYVGEQPEGI